MPQLMQSNFWMVEKDRFEQLNIIQAKTQALSEEVSELIVKCQQLLEDLIQRLEEKRVRQNGVKKEAGSPSA